MRERAHERGAAVAVILASLLAAGCHPTPKSDRYEFIVRVTNDLDGPLAGATVLNGDVSLGRSNDSGNVRIIVQGTEGQEANLTLKCPPKFVTASELRVKLRHLADLTKLPQYNAICSPLERTVVVAIRSDGIDLPVIYLGQELARTDDSGAAHVLLTAPSNTPFELTLGTDETHAVRLRPQNPSMKFMVPDHDDILLFNQPFAELPAARRARVTRPKPAVQAPDPGPTPL